MCFEQVVSPESGYCGLPREEEEEVEVSYDDLWTNLVRPSHTLSLKVRGPYEGVWLHQSIIIIPATIHLDLLPHDIPELRKPELTAVCS